jgi:hypothetical protein
LLVDILSDFDVCGLPKKEQTPALWKLYMCQELTILENVVGMLLSKPTPCKWIIQLQINM